MRVELRHEDGITIGTLIMSNDVACGLRPDDEFTVPGQGAFVVVRKHFFTFDDLTADLVLFVKDRS